MDPFEKGKPNRMVCSVIYSGFWGCFRTVSRVNHLRPRIAPPLHSPRSILVFIYRGAWERASDLLQANLYAGGSLTTRWNGPGMLRLEQAEITTRFPTKPLKGRSPAAQLAAVRRPQGAGSQSRRVRTMYARRIRMRSR